MVKGKFGVALSMLVVGLFVCGAFSNIAIIKAQTEKKDNLAVGDFNQWTVPTSNCNPERIVYDDNTGNMYFTESSLGMDTRAKIGKVTNSGSFTEYTIPDMAWTIANDICLDTSSGDFYFTYYEVYGGFAKIGKMTAGGSFTGYDLNDSAASPKGICYSEYEDCVYFCEYASNKIGKMYCSNGTIKKYDLPSSNSYPTFICYSPVNHKVYFTEGLSRNRIGEMSPLGAFNEYHCGEMMTADLYDICFNPDNSCVYACEFETNMIDEMTTVPVPGTFNRYTINGAGDAHPRGICYSSVDSCLYFTQYAYGKISAMTSIGGMTDYTIPGGGASQPSGICFNPEDYCVYFCELSANKIGQMVTYVELEPSLDNYVGWTKPIANSNITNLDWLNVFANGTGQDLSGGDVILDYYLYWQSNHTINHFYNNTATSDETTWSVAESFETPIVTSDNVCRAIVRVQYVEPLYFSLSDPKPSPMYMTIWGTSSPFTINPPPIILSIDTPIEYDTWQGLTENNITWEATGGTGDILLDIYYTYDDGVSWECLALDETNDGTYTWLVNNTPSDYCLVYMYATDEVDVNTTDTTGYFSISAADITLVVETPEIGDEWQAGTMHSINWTATGGTGEILVDIFYTDNDGDDYYLLADDYENTGFYIWVVNNTPSSLCYIYIHATDEGEGSANEYSGAWFTILPADLEVEVTYPEGDETFEAGDEVNITWNVTGAYEPYSSTVYYSIDNLYTFNLIVDNTTDFYNVWEVPELDETSDDCKILVIGYSSIPQGFKSVSIYDDVELEGVGASEAFTIYVEEEDEVPDEEENGIEIDFEVVGDWVDGQGGTPTSPVNDEITISVRLQCIDGIEGAIIYWYFIPTNHTSAGIWTGENMALGSGNHGDGIWTGQIPAQTEGGMIYYYIYATSYEGDVATTDVGTLSVIESITPLTELTFLGLTMLWWVIILSVIIIIAMVIIYENRKGRFRW